MGGQITVQSTLAENNETNRGVLSEQLRLQNLAPVLQKWLPLPERRDAAW